MKVELSELVNRSKHVIFYCNDLKIQNSRSLDYNFITHLFNLNDLTGVILSKSLEMRMKNVHANKRMKTNIVTTSMADKTPTKLLTMIGLNKAVIILLP